MAGSNIVWLGDHRPQRANSQFIMCVNCGDDTCMIPLGFTNPDGVSFISGLLCIGPKCPDRGSYIEVINGVPQDG